MKDLKTRLYEELGLEISSMELKVFMLPACSSCSAAKVIASEVAKKFDIAFKVIDMATREGLNEGLAHDIRSTPSIAIDEEVIIRGRVLSRERLEEEVKKRIGKWKERAST